ncbi:MAG: aspartate kinase [Verrucomicrobiota bacterium]
MSLIVQKYGGSSVKSAERIQAVAARVKSWRDRGHQVVAVVSAMGGVTDGLIRLAREVNPQPSEREMDMLLATGEQTTIALLAMALHTLGADAVSLTGAQAGIAVGGLHTRAKIANITPERIHEYLDQGNIVTVAGFQGASAEGNIMTLGRGGSDLTAIALAAALKADLCQIYTDVDGVYTADPRVVPHARKIPELSYDEMLEMASSGSKVMQSRSVEFAKKFGVVFEVRNSYNENPGTTVKEEYLSMERVVLRGVSVEKDQAKVTIAGVPDRPGEAARLFVALADAEINVDMIVQNVSAESLTDITFTIPKDDLSGARAVLAPIIDDLGCKGLVATEGICKLSVVGIGMRSHSGVAATLFKALSEAGVNIQMISTSEIKISVVIDQAKMETATRASHDAFGLGGDA